MQAFQPPRGPAAHPAITAPALSLRGISKAFPGVQALGGVDLDLYPGEVTALIGENGAGKSTIVKILTGIYQPDEGEITVAGAPTRFPAAIDAARAGVTAIHQETVLFDDLTVAENIFLGHAPRGRFGLIDWGRMNDEAAALLARVGASVDPKAPLRDLGIASKHLVAISRALSIDARVVIMDEPTAALSQKEIEELYDLIERLRADGKAILFISHKFDEIFRIADRYTVFRDGRLVGAGLMADATERSLVAMMVGREMDRIFPARQPVIGEEVLRVTGYSHPTEFADINFTLRQGEILGFYGLVGAGRSEFMQSLFGVTRPARGACRIDDQVAVIRSPAEAIRRGIVYVPEDRGLQGAIRSMPIFENLTLPSLAQVSRHGFLRMAEEFALTRLYAERLELRAASLDQPLGLLSGGNQQKVVIGKWLLTRPQLILLNDPTRGIDVGTKQELYTLMRELADAGAAILFYSTDYDELVGCCDRVLILYDGRLVRMLEGNEITEHAIVASALNITTPLAETTA